MRIPPGPAAVFILLWAFGYPLGALSVSTMSPMLLLAIRFVISAALMAVLALALRRHFPRGRQLGHVAVAGFLTQGVQFGGLYLGFHLGVPAVISALIIALNPVVTALLSWPLLGQRISARTGAGVAVGLVAVVLACGPRIVDGPAGTTAAVGLTFVGLLGIALGGMYQQRFCSEVDVIAGTSVQIAVGTVPIVALALLMPQHVVHAGKAALVIAAMVALSTIAVGVFFALINQVGATKASMLFSVVPSVSGLMAWGMLGQRPDLGIVLGLFLGAASLVIANGTGRGARQENLGLRASDRGQTRKRGPSDRVFHRA